MEPQRALPTRAEMTTRTGTSSLLNPLRCHPAIPLATTDLSCGNSVKDST